MVAPFPEGLVHGRPHPLGRRERARLRDGVHHRRGRQRRRVPRREHGLIRGGVLFRVRRASSSAASSAKSRDHHRVRRRHRLRVLRERRGVLHGPRKPTSRDVEQVGEAVGRQHRPPGGDGGAGELRRPLRLHRRAVRHARAVPEPEGPRRLRPRPAGLLGHLHGHHGRRRGDVHVPRRLRERPPAVPRPDPAVLPRRHLSPGSSCWRWRTPWRVWPSPARSSAPDRAGRAAR